MLNFIKWLESGDSRVWVAGDPVMDKFGKPFVFYHGTDRKFNKFSLHRSTMGIIWMTSDLDLIRRGGVGASGNGRVVSMHVSIVNPAGWSEYDQLLLVQLKSQGFDGAILDERDGSFNAFVFSPNQIKILDNRVIE